MKAVMRNLIAVAALAMPMIATQAVAAEPRPDGAPPAEMTELSSFLCKDIMRLSGEERSLALAVLHGYHLGKQGSTSFQSAKLGQLTDDFIEHCLDHPADKAMDAFQKITDK